jgi:hypothetical protein
MEHKWLNCVFVNKNVKRTKASEERSRVEEMKQLISRKENFWSLEYGGS